MVEFALLVGDIADFVGIVGNEVVVVDFEEGTDIGHCRAEIDVRMQRLWLVTRRMKALHWLRRRCRQVHGVGVWVRDQSRGLMWTMTKMRQC